SFDFHVEVVIGAGKPDDAATADYAATAAKPNQAVTAQSVNVDPIMCSRPLAPRHIVRCQIRPSRRICGSYLLPAGTHIKVLHCFHQTNDDSKGDVAHTPLPIRPSKSPDEH